MNKKLIFTTAFALISANIHCESSPSMVFNDVITNVRLEKIIDKLMKQEKIGSTKDMMDIMLEVKDQVEHHIGTKISITHSINHILAELDSKGHSISHDLIDSLKNQISVRQKKGHFHRMYIAKVLQTEGMEFNIEDEALLFNAESDIDMKKQHKLKIVAAVPTRMVYGFMLSLCGVFIDSIPLTPDHVWGRNLIDSGVSILCE